MKKEIDVTSNKVYDPDEGQIFIDGEQVVIWVNGKAGHVKTTSNEMIK